ncbi:hypothetical protein G3480_08265 [Thiorhodococcus mannitoliphagus]|uniref:Uncharacterized protein n=1 Tax=Thiorhodococcus mannitoliphagus TaxID=329406 RepID=A0A6P1DTM6_9GAMM|nr:hypothetical protein [Thiorhodococcus mannitoliphagus]NEX20301.1 hypothetical protein [Thiorhodococcus mannitoliphagus]
MRTSWNRREHEALRGLSLLAKTLYLLVFRHRMDYATGIAGGAAFPITYQTVLSELEFLPTPGSTRSRQLPSKGEVRAAIRALERRGLLTDAGSDRRQGYVKRLALADCDKAPSAQRPGSVPADMSTQATRVRRPRQTPSMTPPPAPTAPARDRPPPAVAAESSTLRVTSDPTPVTPQAISPSVPVLESLAYRALTSECVDPERPDPVSQVFDYWHATMNKTRCRLDNKRRRAIAGRLKDGYSVEELREAIDGCKGSAWHQGANINRRVYDDIELICRDAVKVDQFRSIADAAQREQRELEDFLSGGNGSSDSARTFDGEYARVD